MNRVRVLERLALGVEEVLLEDLHGAALDEANASVARTPQHLKVLQDAGVVDAGGKGFTLLLAAVREVVTGEPIPEPEIVSTPASVTAHLAGRPGSPCTAGGRS